ncbi:ABC transporter substrate-binding protein [Mycoplasmopsis lipofaciens]|uniref:ABC transporter substrate-binding protein n=1 Tax=Mycoplasmopsis lipofaciens TaxID=114884 RepID=UPI00048264AB|nr:ABC transporter substrate-binding protein [Mycoplasmopsis lipofaciens]
MRKKILLNLGMPIVVGSTLMIASCSNASEKQNPTTKQYNRDSSTYDLGLATNPINSLNYIKFASVNKILPTLVEGPLKTGPNESVKRILNLPEIPMGIFGNDANSNTMEDFLKNHENAAKSVSGRFYSLDQFGATTGNSIGKTGEYQPISGIFTKNNNILSMHILLNEGESKWSNGDPVQADDYVDAMHYILDLNTGSQKQTATLQRKFKSSSEMIEAQQQYIKKHKKPYINPFGYPELIKQGDHYVYDVFSSSYKPWSSQNPNDDEEVAAIKKAALNLGIYNGRMYWNHSNKEIFDAIKYSPDFDFNAEETIVMLPNPEYSLAKHTKEELKNINQRIAVKVRKYLYSDPLSKTNKEFAKLLKASKLLKIRLNNIKFDEENPNIYNDAVNKLYKGENVLSNDDILNFKPRDFFEFRTFAFDEYSVRVEYDSYQPTSITNGYRDLTDLIPINRKFVESIGGITEFGLDKSKFLTNGAFDIDDLVLGPQGYIMLKKNNQYYSADKTISNKIKIFFSSDPNINSAMYDDNYIAATRIPAVQQLNYWTNLEYRKNMNKSAGFGTIALAFNLDQETNGSSYIQDENLRNAIYYAIDRDSMLNIVGWNSSYPVITWTAFGNGSSSFGDPVEMSFDHDFMYTKYQFDEFYNAFKGKKDSELTEVEKQQKLNLNKKLKSIPVQNYSHIDHLSKIYNFEHVDRTDKAYHLDIARFYLEEFKKTHPGVEKVHLKYISNSTDEQQNAGIALQDFMKKAFGDFVEIEIKGLPENVYEDSRTTGQFDLLYRNFDAFGSDTYSYVKAFFKTDEINKANQKQTGFRNNPSGGWTYQKYFEKLGFRYEKSIDKVISIFPELAEKTRKRLRIWDRSIWSKILELVFVKDDEDASDFNKRHLSFFSNQFTKEETIEGWTEKKVFAVIAALEKIIRDGAPVVPLMEVDTYWEVSRVGGVAGLFTYSLQFAYDVANPSRPNLPRVTKEG